GGAAVDSGEPLLTLAVILALRGPPLLGDLFGCQGGRLGWTGQRTRQSQRWRQQRDSQKSESHWYCDGISSTGSPSTYTAMGRSARSNTTRSAHAPDSIRPRS